MPLPTEPSRKPAPNRLRLGLYLLGLLLITVLAALPLASAYAGVLADRPNQTVPIPSPTVDQPPLPTVTPTFTPPPPTNTPVPPTNTPVPPTNTPAPPTDTPTTQPGADTPTPQPTATNTPAPTDTATTEPTPEPTEAATATPIPAFALEMQMAFAPAFPLAGEELRIEYHITNPADEPALNVTLRNLLPGDLLFVEGESETGELSEETDFGGGLVLLFQWDEIGPGEEVLAAVVVQLAEDIPAGSVIDNLAVVFADNANPTSSGVSIGLPPALLPSFGG